MIIIIIYNNSAYSWAFDIEDKINRGSRSSEKITVTLYVREQ